MAAGAPLLLDHRRVAFIVLLTPGLSVTKDAMKESGNIFQKCSEELPEIRNWKWRSPK
jgi:hypothetical protein